VSATIDRRSAPARRSAESRASSANIPVVSRSAESDCYRSLREAIVESSDGWSCRPRERNH
jgi:hypothetical protein